MPQTLDDKIRALLASRLASAPAPPPFERCVPRPEEYRRGRSRLWPWVASTVVVVLGLILAVVILAPARPGERTRVAVGQRAPASTLTPSSEEQAKVAPDMVVSSGDEGVAVKASEGCPDGEALCVDAAGPALRQAPLLEVRRGAAMSVALGTDRTPVGVNGRVIATPNMRHTETIIPAPTNPIRIVADLPGGSYYMILVVHWADMPDSTYFVQLRIVN